MFTSKAQIVLILVQKLIAVGALAPLGFSLELLAAPLGWMELDVHFGCGYPTPWGLEGTKVYPIKIAPEKNDQLNLPRGYFPI